MKNSHLDRRTKYSQKMIQTALINLLEEKELGTITVTDICNAADVNRGTFYKYYRDVGDLYYQMEDGFINDIFQMFLEARSADEAAGRDGFDIDMVLGNVLILLSENRDFFRVTQKGKTTSRMVQKILTFIQPYAEQLIQNSCGCISEEETAYRFEFILGGASSVVTKWIDDNMKTPVPQMQEMLIRIIHGLLAL